MYKILWIVLALLAGALLPVQTALNSRLGKAADSPVHAALISFLVGGVALLLYILLTRQTLSWEGLRQVPAYTWLGGLLGAFFVTVSILAFPRLGPGLTFGLIVAGQMSVSLLLEHFNILVAQQQPLGWMRMLGIVLVVAGVVIIRRF